MVSLIGVFLFIGVFFAVDLDGGDDFHGLAAVAADPWVVVPDFADESGPGAPPVAEELWFGLSFGAWGTGRSRGGNRRRRGTWELWRRKDRGGLEFQCSRGRRDKLRRRLVDRRILDPACAFSKCGRDGAVAPHGDLVFEAHVRNEHCEEFDRSHQLMIDAQPRMKFRPLVMDHPVAPVSEPPDADGGALHVAQKALEAWTVFGFDPPIPVQVEQSSCRGPAP